MKNLTAEQARKLKVGDQLIFIGYNKNYDFVDYLADPSKKLIGKKCKIINIKTLSVCDDREIDQETIEVLFLKESIEKSYYWWRFAFSNNYDDNIVCKNKK